MIQVIYHTSDGADPQDIQITGDLELLLERFGDVGIPPLAVMETVLSSQNFHRLMLEGFQAGIEQQIQAIRERANQEVIQLSRQLEEFQRAVGITGEATEPTDE